MNLAMGINLYLNGTTTMGTFRMDGQEKNTLLGGSGTIDCALVEIKSYGNCIIAPGDNAVGTLSFIGGGELELEAGSIYEWEIGRPGSTDTIDIDDGTLDLDNFNLKILDAGGVGGYVENATDELDLFTYSTTTTPDFVVVTGRPGAAVVLVREQ